VYKGTRMGLRYKEGILNISSTVNVVPAHKDYNNNNNFAYDSGTLRSF
jgi:hypothetical protein